jgi:hypothetical protein
MYMSDPDDPKSFDPRFPVDEQPTPEQAAAQGQADLDNPPPVAQEDPDAGTQGPHMGDDEPKPQADKPKGSTTKK